MDIYFYSYIATQNAGQHGYPCSVNAYGIFLVPLQLDVPFWNIKFLNSSSDKMRQRVDAPTDTGTTNNA